MIINKALNEVFSTYSNIAVMRELQFTTNGLTGREVAKKAGISPPSALSALAHLESLKIVKRQVGGRDHIFTLNFSNIIVKQGILPLLSLENNLLNIATQKIKKEIFKYCISTILFGSVARKEEEIGSDMDICIIYDDSKNRVSIEEKVSDLRDVLYKSLGITLATFYINLTDFKRKARLKKPPVKNIISEGKVLFGKTIKELLRD